MTNEEREERGGHGQATPLDRLLQAAIGLLAAGAVLLGAGTPLIVPPVIRATR